MVEDMYQQELKEADDDDEEAEHREMDQSNNTTTSNNSGTMAQTPTTTTTTTSTPTKISDVNNNNASLERDPPLMNRQPPAAVGSGAAPPISQCYRSELPLQGDDEDTCRHGSMVAGQECGTTSASGNSIGATMIRFGTTAGDVSLTLGLRHAGNIPDTSPFSVTDFGGI